MSLSNLQWKKLWVFQNLLQFSNIFVVFQWKNDGENHLSSESRCTELTDLLFADDHQRYLHDKR